MRYQLHRRQTRVVCQATAVLCRAGCLSHLPPPCSPFDLTPNAHSSAYYPPLCTFIAIVGTALSTHTGGPYSLVHTHTYAVCVYWCEHQLCICVLLNEVKLTSTAKRDTRFVQPVDSAGDRLHSCMYGACTLSQITLPLVPIGSQQSVCLFEHSGTTFHIA